MSRPIWSVSHLVKYLKSNIENEPVFNQLLIKGEISNFTAHRSGHYYFTLKDATSRMNCVMFSSYTKRVRFPIKEGSQVIVAAKLSVYEAGGSVQLYVTDMQLDGIGDLYLQLEQSKKKLFAEGLFDEKLKKPLPEYPQDIAFLSAKQGAATQDVYTTLKRRWPLARVTFYPTLVQGAQADVEIIQTLKQADQNHHDVILIVRGGGSIEDLWCFNSEALAYCVASCVTPIVSGVGHETDTTLIDYVSDKRAPTPTAAAELVTPSIHEVKQGLMEKKNRLMLAMKTNLKTEKMHLDQMKAYHYLANPLEYMANDMMHLDYQQQRLMHFITNIEKEKTHLSYAKKQLKVHFEALQDNLNQNLSFSEDLLNHHIKNIRIKAQKELYAKISLLDAFSPLKILERGYSLSFMNERIIKSVDEVEKDQLLTTRFHDGVVVSKVIQKEVNHGGKDI